MEHQSCFSLFMVSDLSCSRTFHALGQLGTRQKELKVRSLYASGNESLTNEVEDDVVMELCTHDDSLPPTESLQPHTIITA